MSSFIPKSCFVRQRGFTLVEMLVSVTILVMIMVLATQMIGATSKIWKNTTSKIEAFQGARDGFQLMTDELRQATLNTYWDYFNASGLPRSSPAVAATSFVPIAYGRQSELNFVSGPLPDILGRSQITDGVMFQAPLDYTATPASYGKLQNMLNATGFFIEFSNGTGNGAYVNNPPAFLNIQLPYRYRLVQFIQPTEQLGVYNYWLNIATLPATWAASNNWFSAFIAGTPHPTNVRIVANNIIGLIIWPKASDSTTDDASLTNNTYHYDSRLVLGRGTGTTAVSGVFSFASWTPSATPGASPQPLMMNQMPPIIRVAMIALDEPSAMILQGTSTSAPSKITSAFTQTSTGGGALFSNPLYMDSDLLTLQTGPKGLASITPHLNFRVFETTVTVKSARFSTK